LGLQSVVEKGKCEGCEESMNNCPVGVSQMVGGRREPVQAEACEECETFISVCTTGAVTLQ